MKDWSRVPGVASRPRHKTAGSGHPELSTGLAELVEPHSRSTRLKSGAPAQGRPAVPQGHGPISLPPDEVQRTLLVSPIQSERSDTNVLCSVQAIRVVAPGIFWRDVSFGAALPRPLGYLRAVHVQWPNATARNLLKQTAPQPQPQGPGEFPLPRVWGLATHKTLANAPSSRFSASKSRSWSR